MTQVKSVFCLVCEHYFRRESDRACHKCITGRQQPVDQQSDVVQFHKCGSKGEFAVHKCKTVEPSTQLEPVAEQSVICLGVLDGLETLSGTNVYQRGNPISEWFESVAIM